MRTPIAPEWLGMRANMENGDHDGMIMIPLDDEDNEDAWDNDDEDDNEDEDEDDEDNDDDDDDIMIWC